MVEIDSFDNADDVRSFKILTNRRKGRQRSVGMIHEKSWPTRATLSSTIHRRPHPPHSCPCRPAPAAPPGLTQTSDRIVLCFPFPIRPHQKAARHCCRENSQPRRQNPGRHRSPSHPGFQFQLQHPPGFSAGRPQPADADPIKHAAVAGWARQAKRSKAAAAARRPRAVPTQHAIRDFAPPPSSNLTLERSARLGAAELQSQFT